MPSLTMVLCGGQQLFLAALAALLADRGHNVATCATPAAAVDVIWARPVDICVLELNDEDNSQLRAITTLVSASRDTRVVVLSSSNNTQLLSRAVTSGARGVALKSEPSERLFEVIDLVHAGQVVVPRDLPSGSPPCLDWRTAGGTSRLTEREEQVLRHLVQGEGARSIAARLGVEYSTARSYIQKLLTKLGVHSKLEAVALAVNEGLVDLQRLA